MNAKPLVQDVCAIPDDVIDAQLSLNARRKLSLILKSKAITEVPINTGDTVEIYSKKDFDKRGQWPVTKKILKVDQNARIITVAGKMGNQ